jgi:hypothetical protein
MEPLSPDLSRHQCLVYEGAPSRQLSALAASVHNQLNHGYRCLCLNSAPMIAGMRSYLAAANVDVEGALTSGSLVLVSEQQHLVDGHFDPDRLMSTLEETLHRALRDGYAGLWATGDMTWEMGPDRDFSKLLEYEWRLEEFFREHPQLSGICQYHVDTLPWETVRQGLLAHQAVFVNETLSLLNPHAIGPRSTRGMADDSAADSFLARVLHAAGLGEPGKS